MNFYLEKVNNENNIWKNAIYITFVILILHLTYNFIYDNDNDDNNDKYQK
jgi:hypothetical protein